MDYIIVLDYGTTTLKATLFDLDFSPLVEASHEWEYIYPGEGKIELEPKKYIDAAFKVIKSITPKEGFQGKSVAISVTGQAETLITIDKDGVPFDNAWVWLDTRANQEGEYFKRFLDEKSFHDITGIPGYDTILPLLKLKFMRENEPERFRRTSKFLLLKDYVVYEFTGVVESDHTVACCSGYMDIKKKTWDDDLLKLAGIDKKKLPTLVSPSHIAGRIKDNVAYALSLPKDTIVLSGLLDQCASAIGCGNFDTGVVCETTGTALAIAATVDTIPDAPALPILCHGIDGKYLALPNSSTAGALLEWLTDKIVPELRERTDGNVYKYIDSVLETRGVRDGLVFLPHFCGYMSPVSNPDATGVIYGLTLDTDRIDIAGSIMEGVSFLIRENLELLEDSGFQSPMVLSLGGGAKSRYWLQLKADILGKEISVLLNSETTALGCAFGAAVSLGIKKNYNEFKKYIGIKNTYYPRDEKRKAYNKKYTLYKSLNKCLGFYGEQKGGN